MPRKLKPTYRRRRKRATASQAEPSFDSKFFKLPPELRNYIYELALTYTEENVYMSWLPGTTQKTQKPEITVGDSKDPLNCLKYVNRQLRQETKGLEIKVNAVKFVGSRTQAAVRRFFKFTISCSSAKLKWLRRVSLEEEAAAKDKTMFLWLGNNRKNVVDLFTFCAENPQTTAELRVPWFEIIDRKDSDEYKAYLFVGLGIILTLMFRGEDISFIAPQFGDDTSAACHRLSRKMLKEHRNNISALRNRATNLRFFPREVDWNADEFRTSAVDGWNESAQDPHLLPGDAIEKWLDYATIWMKEGV